MRRLVVRSIKYIDEKECFMKDIVSVRYPENSWKIADYQRKIITMDLCDFFFSGTFVNEDDTVNYYADTSNYISISSLENESAVDMINILIMIISGIQQAVNYYFEPEKLFFSPETVFVDRRKTKVKCLLCPTMRYEISEEKGYYDVSLNYGKILKPLRDKFVSCTMKESRNFTKKAFDLLDGKKVSMTWVLSKLNAMKDEIRNMGIEEDPVAKFFDS